MLFLHAAVVLLAIAFGKGEFQNILLLMIGFNTAYIADKLHHLIKKGEG